MSQDKHLNQPKCRGKVRPAASESAQADNLWLLSELQLKQERDLQFCMQAGLLLSGEQFTEALGIDAAAIRKGLDEGKYIVVTVESGREYYPHFCTYTHFLHFGALAAVITVMVGVSDIEKFYFLTSPSYYLRGKTPLAALDDGQFDNVLVAARALVER